MVIDDDGHVKGLWDRLRDMYRESWIPLIENRTLNVTFVKNTATSSSSPIIQTVVIKKPANYRLAKQSDIPVPYEITPFISYKTVVNVFNYEYDVSETIDAVTITFIFEDPIITDSENFIQASFDIQVLLEEVL
jgi:hypothetical protein